jgi:3-dehydroquinate synthase
MIIRVNLPQNPYDIYLERGIIEKAGTLLNLQRKCLIVTDSGVPEKYSKTVASSCKEFNIITIPQGESSKSFDNYKMLCSALLEFGFTRTDCVVAVGGGVVGDLAGFAASTFMRGIDFYNIPTTLLSQVDSSIGGKVAINLSNVKNIIGAFHQPKRVLIDPDVLSTLPQRQISNGLAEAFKMSLTSDEELYGIFKEGKAFDRIEKVIELSLKIKAFVVEQDEKETGLRKILNFGHTLGHGIEAEEELRGMYHGECVAIGMIPMCGKSIREEVKNILTSLNLPTKINGNLEKMLSAATHDKKCDGMNISVIRVNTPGSFIIDKITVEEWKEEIRTVLLENS